MSDDKEKDKAAAAFVPATPFTSLNAHFGMLLGVEDIQALDAYARGKVRLHNAWLHGAGVVWGLDVRLDQPDAADPSRDVLRVEPGLALDAPGHEIHVDSPGCLVIGDWYGAHRKEVGVDAGTDGVITFDAHVVLRFDACLSRAVPAVSQPCAGTQTDVEYSRVFETAQLQLVPTLWKPAQAQRPYHRLRLLLGIDDPVTDDQGHIVAADEAVMQARTDLAASTNRVADAAKALRQFAALDVIDRRPWTPPGTSLPSLFPSADDEPVVLANLAGIGVKADGTRFILVNRPTIDTTVRPSHVPTSILQELFAAF